MDSLGFSMAEALNKSVVDVEQTLVAIDWKGALCCQWVDGLLGTLQRTSIERRDGLVSEPGRDGLSLREAFRVQRKVRVASKAFFASTQVPCSLAVPEQEDAAASPWKTWHCEVEVTNVVKTDQGECTTGWFVIETCEVAEILADSPEAATG
jgi:hypothetical protein